MSYSRGGSRTVISSNNDITSGKDIQDMYGAGIDTIRAIAQKLDLGKLVFKYGALGDKLTISVSVISV